MHLLVCMDFNTNLSVVCIDTYSKFMKGGMKLLFITNHMSGRNVKE